MIVMTIIVMMTPQFLKYKVWFGYLIRGAFRKWKMVKVGIDQNAQTWDKFPIRGGGVKPAGPNSQLLPKTIFEGSPYPL